MFDRLDANGDGYVDRSEALAEAAVGVTHAELVEEPRRTQVERG